MTRSSAGWARQGAICLLSVQFTFTQESRERPAQLTSLLSHQANDYYCREREREREMGGDTHRSTGWVAQVEWRLKKCYLERYWESQMERVTQTDTCWAPNIAYHKGFCSVDKIFFETFPNLAVVSPWSQYKLLRVSQTQVRSDLDQPRPFIFQFLIDVGHINSSRQSRLIH